MRSEARCTFVIVAGVLFSAGIAHAQTAILTPFTLRGKVAIGTCDGKGGVANRPIIGAGIPITNTTFTQFSLGHYAQVNINDLTTPEVFDGSYTQVLQRDVGGELVSYRFSYGIVYQNSTRRLEITNPTAWNFTAPAEGDLVNDFPVLQNAVSFRVSALSQGAGDRIVNIEFTVQPPDRQSVFYFIGSNMPRFGNDPAAVDGFILTTNGQDQDTALAEILLPSNRDYNVTGTVTWTNDRSATFSAFVPGALLLPCGVYTLPIELTAPPAVPRATLAGQILLRPDAADLGGRGPRATSYQVAFTANGGQDLPTITNAAAPPDDTATSYSRTVIPNVRRSSYSNAAYGSFATLAWPPSFGPGATANPERRWTAFWWGTRVYLWPLLGLLSPSRSLLGPVDFDDKLATGIDRDGFTYLDPGEQQTWNFVADMAYVSGRIDFIGCGSPNDIAAGDAFLQGVADGPGGTFIDERGVQRTVLTGNVGGIASGIFRANRTGVYEIVATEGKWREMPSLQGLFGGGAYNILLRRGQDADADGYLHQWLGISPAPPRAFDLRPGRNNEVTGNNHTYAPSKITVHCSVMNPDNTPRPFRSPEVVINSTDFGDRATSTVLGSYRAHAFGSNTLKRDHFVTLLAMPESTVRIDVSAMVPTNADGTGPQVQSNFPSLLNVPITCTGGCCQICIDLQTQQAHTDDEMPPMVVVEPPPPALTAGSSVLIQGTASDQVPIPTLQVQVNGQAVPVTITAVQGGKAFQAQVPLAEGTNQVVVEVKDLCGHTTQRTYTIERTSQPLCIPPPSDLVAWYPGDIDGRDLIAGNDLMSSGVSIVPAEVNNGFRLDPGTPGGGTPSMQAADAPALNFDAQTSFTFEFWFRFTGGQQTCGGSPTNRYHTLLEKRALMPGSVLGYSVFLDCGKPGFQLAPGGANFHNYFADGPDLRDGAFHHLAVVVDRGSPTGSHIYVDGVAMPVYGQAGFNATGVGSLINSHTLMVGAPIRSTDASPLPGTLDEISVYHRALSAAEVAAIYGAGANGKCLR